jgi:hypothetical protein
MSDLIDNQDGSYSYEFEAGKPTKLVKESDLQGHKSASQQRETALMSQLAEANRLHDEEHQNFLKEQTARQTFEATAREVEAHRTMAKDWESKHMAEAESHTKTKEQLLGRTKSHMAMLYGVDEETLKDKTLEDLSNLEKAYQLVGAKGGKKPNFDGSGGGAVGGKPPESNDERLDRILEEAKSRNKR